MSREFVMEPYNPSATCPKCGHDDVNTAHHAKGKYMGTSRMAEHFKTSYPPENMWRSCRRCGFGWPQAPINAEAE